MDLEIVKLHGEKLNEPAEEVGADSEQLTAQHNRVASAAGVVSLLFALSQHSIISSFTECSGVPDTMPPARATSKDIKVSLFTIK